MSRGYFAGKRTNATPKQLLTHPAPVVSDPATADQASPRAFEPDDVWQRLWFSMIEIPWTSLAIVPVDENVPPNHLAEMVVALGRHHRERDIHFIDARGTRLADVQAVVESITRVDETARVITVVDAVSSNPATVHIARSVSAVLLIAKVGTSRLAAAKATAAAIGAGRIIGTVALV